MDEVEKKLEEARRLVAQFEETFDKIEDAIFDIITIFKESSNEQS